MGRFWAKIDHGTPLESIFWKNHFLIIFDFWIVGLWTLSAEFWFIRLNIGRSVIFSENIPIKVLSPKNVQVRTLNWLPYTNFCEFSPNSIFYNILRLGEEFFARSSYGKNFYTMKKYEVWAFQRRVERISAILQSWDILVWSSKSRCTTTFAECFQVLSTSSHFSQLIWKFSLRGQKCQTQSRLSLDSVWFQKCPDWVWFQKFRKTIEKIRLDVVAQSNVISPPGGSVGLFPYFPMI